MSEALLELAGTLGVDSALTNLVIAVISYITYLVGKRSRR